MENQVVLSDADISKLKSGGAGVSILDNQGHVVGVFLPVFTGNEDISDEECERRFREERRYTTAEVLAYIENLPDIPG